MSSLETTETHVLAHLARLSLEPEEEQRFSRQLTTILQYVETLQNVNTDGVAEYVASAAEASHLREDRADPAVNSEQVIAEILSSVPHRQKDLVLVPKIKSAES